MTRKKCLKRPHKRQLETGDRIIVCKKGKLKIPVKGREVMSSHSKVHKRRHIRKHRRSGHKGLPSKYIKRYGGITSEGWDDYYSDHPSKRPY